MIKGHLVTIPSPLGRNYKLINNSKRELLPTDYDPITKTSGRFIYYLTLYLVITSYNSFIISSKFLSIN